MWHHVQREHGVNPDQGHPVVSPRPNSDINKRKTLVQQETQTQYTYDNIKNDKTGEPQSKLKTLLQENIQLFRMCKKL